MRLKQFMVKVLAVCIMTSSISSFPITSMASVETVSLTEDGGLGNEKDFESEENANKESAEDTGEKEEIRGEAALEDETGVQEEETAGEEKVEESVDPESTEAESTEADQENIGPEDAEADPESTEADLGDSESVGSESTEADPLNSEDTNGLLGEVQEGPQGTETSKEPDVVGIDESLMGSITPYNIEIEPQQEKKYAYIVADYTTAAYGEPLPELTYTGFGFEDGIPSDLEVTPKVSYSGTGLIGVGTYTIEFENPVVETDDYIVDYVPGTLVVIKSAKIIYAGSTTRMYGEDNSLYYDWGGATSYTDEFLELLDTIPELMVTTAGRYSPVGVYPITFAEEKQIPNYDITYIPGTLEVIKRTLDIRTQSYTKVYGEENPALTWEVNGFLAMGDWIDIEIETTAGQYSPVGVYPISIRTNPMPNYDIQYTPGTLGVTKRPLYIRVYSDTKVYGEENPVLKYEVDGLAGSDTLESLGIEPKLITTAEKNSPAGNYEIAFEEEMVSSNPNYDIQYIPGTLTILPGEQAPDPEEGEAGDNEANPDDNSLSGGSTETGGESTGNNVDTEISDQNTAPNIDTDTNTDTGSSNMDSGTDSADTRGNSETPHPSIPNDHTDGEREDNSIGLIVTPTENTSTSDSIVPAENEMAVVLPDNLPDVTQNEKVISTGIHRSSDSDSGSEYLETDIKINRTAVFGGLATNFESIEEINPKLFTGVDNKVESDSPVIIEKKAEISNIERVRLKGIAIIGFKIIQEHTSIIIFIWLLILFALILLNRRPVKQINRKVASKRR